MKKVLVKKGGNWKFEEGLIFGQKDPVSLWRDPNHEGLNEKDHNKPIVCEIAVD